MHVRIERCVNVQAYNVMLTAPEKSPNTDGIHVTASQNVQIISSTIRTGKPFSLLFFFFFDNCVIIRLPPQFQSTDTWVIKLTIG